MTATTPVRAAAIVAPTWRAARLWVALVVLVLAAGIGLAVYASSPATTPLDPSSSAPAGSKALAVLLGERDSAVTKTTSPDAALAADPAATVLVTSPDDLSADQLRQLAGHRLVLIDPGVAALAAVTTTYQLDDVGGGSAQPDCAWAGAQAAGAVDFPDATSIYSGPASCYGGAVVVTDQLVILGSTQLLRNDQLASSNIAALTINAISDDGSATRVEWLLPGIDDAGGGTPSVWALFPQWAQRAFWWLLVVGALTALWKGRRLGPVVSEALPVVVRSAEVVEGHGRLYRRAHARERAAMVLREATAARLHRRFGPDDAAAASVRAGPVPGDDEALLRLANDLRDLEGNLRHHD